MSVPPGTEMFQFPGFASLHYVFVQRYPCGWVAPFGYPRINACSRLPVAFRSVPRPSSPPGAKASTECPCYTRYPGRASKEARLTMHRNHPQTQIEAEPENDPGTIYSLRTQPISSDGRFADRARRSHKDPSNKIVHRASEPSPPTVGVRFLRTAIPGQTSRPNDGPGTAVSGQRPVVSQKTAIAPANTKTHLSRAHAPRDAPEPDSQYKRTTPPNRTAQTAWPHTQGALPRHMIKPNSGHSAILIRRSAVSSQWSGERASD